jgi:hypothetical protein
METGSAAMQNRSCPVPLPVRGVPPPIFVKECIMAVTQTKTAGASHAWGIILGLAGIPVVALLLKIFPAQHIVWDAFLALLGLVVVKSMVSYLLAGRRPADADSDSDASPAH